MFVDAPVIAAARRWVADFGHMRGVKRAA